jgi:hypothetical protein
MAGFELSTNRTRIVPALVAGKIFARSPHEERLGMHGSIDPAHVHVLLTRSGGDQRRPLFRFFCARLALRARLLARFDAFFRFALFRRFRCAMYSRIGDMEMSP